MAGSLGKTGRTLGLVGSIIAAILAIADLVSLDVGVSTDSITSFGFVSSREIRAILSIIFAILLFMFCSDRYKIDNQIVFGIIVIVIGLAAGYIGGLLAVVGGILIIVDAL
ncbi:MAG: hypothetical protein ACXAD7_10585 [Candidatus Kariarchaeaceae archaeon]|jgi:hypothetical protein